MYGVIGVRVSGLEIVPAFLLSLESSHSISQALLFNKFLFVEGSKFRYTGGRSRILLQRSELRSVETALSEVKQLELVCYPTHSFPFNHPWAYRSIELHASP